MDQQTFSHRAIELKSFSCVVFSIRNVVKLKSVNIIEIICVQDDFRVILVIELACSKHGG